MVSDYRGGSHSVAPARQLVPSGIVIGPVGVVGETLSIEIVHDLKRHRPVAVARSPTNMASETTGSCGSGSGGVESSESVRALDDANVVQGIPLGPIGDDRRDRLHAMDALIRRFQDKAGRDDLSLPSPGRLLRVGSVDGSGEHGEQSKCDNERAFHL